MKKTTTLKAFVLSLAMALVAIFPTTMNAQRSGSDGFFSGGGETYENRNDGVTWNGMVAQNPENQAPLGSGLLILTVAGVGYVALKRKRNFKTTVTMLLACVMLMGMTQCKKKAVETSTPTEGIKMTLVADNGAKTSFDEYCNISWEINERVFVFVNGVCRGSLTNGEGGGNTFSGTLTSFDAGTYDFYFYYLGNAATASTIESGATSFSMDFSNQDGTRAHLGKNHFGCGKMENVKYDGGTSISAQALMRSYVSIGLFNTTGMAKSGEKVYFYGEKVNNNVSVSFSDGVPTYTYGKTNSGYICAGTPSDKTYVVLVPNHTDGTESNPTAFTFVSKRTTGSVAGTKFQYGIIGGRFYCEGGNTSSAISTNAVAYEGDILRGDFSVASETTVKFSQGNLQYTRSTGIFSFMENQYSMVERNGSVNDDYLGATTVSMFGWGTSGWKTNTCYQPYHTSSDKTKYGPTGNYNLTGDYANADWGFFNKAAIVGGGNHEWHTLSIDEWIWLLGPAVDPVPGTNCRESSTVNGTANARFTYATLSIGGSNYKGMLIFPDAFTAAATTGVKWGDINTFSNYTTSCTSEVWNTLESAGCVFLPAAGYRNGTTVSDVNTHGLYWSTTSSSDDSNTSAYKLDFSSTTYKPNDAIHRFAGRTVRLVF